MTVTNTDLVPVHTADILRPVSVDQAKQAMREYQEVTSAILEPSDWQGPAGREGSFVKKSGFRKIAKAYGLSVERLSESVDRDDEENPIRAQATFRAIGPNGQHMDATGYCSVNERRFHNEGGRQKIENDLRATAETRAKNRAISDLVAFGQVSAEEVDDPTPAATGERYATEQDYQAAAQAVEQIRPDIDGPQFVKTLANSFEQRILPESAAKALKGLAWWINQQEETANQTPEKTEEQP